jgi:hypothetical protein
MRYLPRVIPGLTRRGGGPAGWFSLEEKLLEFINPHYSNREIGIDGLAEAGSEVSSPDRRTDPSFRRTGAGAHFKRFFG